MIDHHNHHQKCEIYLNSIIIKQSWKEYLKKAKVIQVSTNLYSSVFVCFLCCVYIYIIFNIILEIHEVLI